MSSILVKNTRAYHGAGYYIGRPSLLGNPFVIGKYGTRAQVIEKYRVWLDKQIESNIELRKLMLTFCQEYKTGKRIVLICWCAPLACHGDVIAAKIKSMSKELDFQDVMLHGARSYLKRKHV
jgi:hypothetical protein